MKLEEKLTVLRKRKGVSQQELAERMDVSRQAISRWEVGDAVPSTEKLKYLAQLYGVTVDYLLDDSASEPKRDDGLLSEKAGEAGKRKTVALLVAVLAILVVILGALLLADHTDKEDYVPIENIEGSDVDTVGDFEIEIDW